MQEPVDIVDGVHVPRGSRSDRGATFVELLISLVLLGIAVIGVLVALQATTVASTKDADHARASVWLHDASDAIFETPRTPCAGIPSGDPDLPSSYPDQRALALANYQAVVTTVPAPQGWSGATIAVTELEFLAQVDPYLPDFTWTNACFEGVQPDGPDADSDPDDYRSQPLLSQKITIVATSPSGQIVKMLETVKGDR